MCSLRPISTFLKYNTHEIAQAFPVNHVCQCCESHRLEVLLSKHPGMPAPHEVPVQMRQKDPLSPQHCFLSPPPAYQSRLFSTSSLDPVLSLVWYQTSYTSLWPWMLQHPWSPSRIQSSRSEVEPHLVTVETSSCSGISSRHNIHLVLFTPLNH